MKKIIISTLALSLTWLSFTVTVSESTYRTQFEKRMYARTGSVLSKAEYEKLINPFLNKAESELKSVRFCEENRNCVECQNYSAALLDYNVTCFLNYAQSNDGTNCLLNEHRTRLERSIKALAKQGALQQDEVETELQKTELLFLDGNKAFYSALPWHIKFGLWRIR